LKFLTKKRVILFWSIPFFLIFGSMLHGKAANAETGKGDSRPLQILCLGDSITQSADVYCGYRYSLWKKLVDLGIEFDLIGSMKERYFEDPSGQCPDYKGRKFDPDHEGHWGWHIEHILGIQKDFPEGSGSGSLSVWLKEYTPDIVLLHLGHNDAGMGETPNQMAKELEQVILVLRKDNPNVSILLAKVIPSAKPLWNSRLDALNAEIDGIARKMNIPASRVIVVDFTKGFNPQEDTIDGTHPNSLGSEKMAQKWFESIVELLKEK